MLIHLIDSCINWFMIHSVVCVTVADLEKGTINYCIHIGTEKIKFAL